MRVHPHDLKWLENNALAVAVLVDAGWLAVAPFEWTRGGSRAIRRHSIPGSRDYNGGAMFEEACRFVSRFALGKVQDIEGATNDTFNA